MGIFSRSRRSTDHGPPPLIGRFSDAHKLSARDQHWELAQNHFQKGEARQGFIAMADFLKNKNGNNIRLDVKGERLLMHLVQGSVEVRTELNGRGIRSQVDIARAPHTDIGLMRSLLEENDRQRYSRFALTPKGMIQLIFDSRITDLNAYKLYYALKEVATLADDLDDVLASEWPDVEMVPKGHVHPLPERELKIKIAFFRSEIDSLITYMQDAHYDAQSYRHAQTHILLSTVYKLDHLLVPHGPIRRALQSIHALYYQPQEGAMAVRNDKAWSILKSLRKMDDDEVARELYSTDHTFGQAESVGLDVIRQIFDSESKHFSWYREKGLDTFSVAINEFIIGYVLFNTAPPAPVAELFDLYYRVGESGLFDRLNESGLVKTRGKLKKRKVLKAVERVQEFYVSDYPHLNFDQDHLEFDDIGKFGHSLLKMIVNTNMKRR